MPSSRCLLVAIAATSLVGCATTVDSKEMSYQRGKGAFEARRWREADESLEAFLRASCTSGPASGCQRAVWMKMQADMEIDRPAQALVDWDLSQSLGPVMINNPPFDALRQKALDAVHAKASKPDHSARLQVFYRNGVSAKCHLRWLSYSLDLQEKVRGSTDGLEGKAPLFDSTVFVGEHLVTVYPHFVCALGGDQTAVDLTASHAAFTSAPGPTRLSIRTRELADPPLAPISERLVNDFEVAAPSP